MLARGMGSLFKNCGCAGRIGVRIPTIRFRGALGKQRRGPGYGTQDEALERLTQICAEKKRTASPDAGARRDPCQ
ncbi:hypothetical protein GCM10010303_13250 [Streptomyces purpurascens]|nr:hypothetical protein GCM10010303_13250 [Streptomyces purpurascens]